MNEIRAAVTVAEMVKATGKHKSTVYALIDRGELPGYRTSMGYVIPWYWFDQWQRGEWLPTSTTSVTPSDDVTPTTETTISDKVTPIHKRNQSRKEA